MQSLKRADRISELRQRITDLVNRKRYLMDLMVPGSRERHLATIASLRKNAAEFIAKANAMEIELDTAKECYIAADDQVMETRQQILDVENEESIAELEEIERQLQELSK